MCISSSCMRTRYVHHRESIQLVVKRLVRSPVTSTENRQFSIGSASRLSRFATLYEDEIAPYSDGDRIILLVKLCTISQGNICRETGRTKPAWSVSVSQNHEGWCRSPRSCPRKRTLLLNPRIREWKGAMAYLCPARTRFAAKYAMESRV